MNGLEALDNWYNTEQPKPVEYCFHYNIIRKELKVLQILKEKRVDLYYISPGSQTTIEEKLEAYNFSHKLLPLTLEEMTLIVKWIKGEL